ncbi:hypothetical protein [Enterococcus faecalis]|nr:hypothetical protein [Enterococcus faecalis]
MTDVGFGYSAAGIISILLSVLLSVVTGAIISVVQLFHELIKKRAGKKV